MPSRLSQNINARPPSLTSLSARCRLHTASQAYGNGRMLVLLFVLRLRIALWSLNARLSRFSFVEGCAEELVGARYSRRTAKRHRVRRRASDV